MSTVTSSCESLPVNQIQLDEQNPRIAKWVEMYSGNITAQQMSLALGAGDSQGDSGGTTFRSLCESIKTNGGGYPSDYCKS